MKKIISIFTLFVTIAMQLLYGQSPSENYVHTRTMMNEDGSKQIETFQYYDGLGRPVQIVQKKATPSGNDLATYQEYDVYGRESNAWLPIQTVANNNGSFVPMNSDFTNLSKATYGHDAKAYSKPEYENSPLNRILKQYGPGQDWHNNNKAVEQKYLSNKASGEYACVYYYMDGDNFRKKGYYGENTLFVNEIIDEDNKRTATFADKLGRTVLQRRFDGRTQFDTYYIYDDIGNLCYVLPPLASDALKADNTVYSVSTDAVKKYVYAYKYDKRKRCVEKKLPGCDPVYYVYNKADQLVLSQDGEQRPKNEWTFTKYDEAGRVIISGIHKNTAARVTLETQYWNLLTAETFSLVNTYQGTGYTNNKMPTVNTEWLTVSYYDTYQFLSLSGVSPYASGLRYASRKNYGEKYTFNINNADYSAKTLLSGSRVKMLDKNRKEIVSVVYYDQYARVVQTNATNHLGGLEKEYVAYNFTGQPVAKRLEHTAPGKDAIVQVYHYDYDHAGRITAKYHKIGNSTSLDDNRGKELARYNYDALGRIEEKIMEQDEANDRNGLSEYHTYNVRGWTTGIRSSVFEQKLYYTPKQGIPGGSYNGNINAVWWTNNSHSGTSQGAYSLNYDGLNRLTYSEFLDPKTWQYNYSKDFSESMTFDKHGSPIYISRFGTMPWGDMDYLDDMTLSYSGNQLTRIDDTCDQPNYGSYDFKDRIGPSPEYRYNKNGALNFDYNKNISSIRNNLLNLPDTVQFGQGHATYYRYDASGVKRQAQYITTRNHPYVEMGKVVETFQPAYVQQRDSTDYCGGIIYENGLLKMILTEEGYCEKHTSKWGVVSFPHNYYLCDHLGNTRAVIQIAGTDPNETLSDLDIKQNTDYYPSGTILEMSHNPDVQPYKYGGKELDRMHGLDWSDFHARQLMGAVPLFSSVDPMAEKYYSWSPYVYTMGNPMKYVDPTGMDSWTTTDPDEIERISALLKSGGMLDLTSFGNQWTRLTDEELERVRLADDIAIFDDESFDFTINGQSYKDFQGYGIFPVEASYTFGNSLADALSGIGTGFGSKSLKGMKFYFGSTLNSNLTAKFYSAKFYGNQYISSSRLFNTKSLAKGFSRVGGVLTTGYSIYQIIDAYLQEGYIGPQTQKTVAATAGGFAGASLGAKAGATIGGFGGPWGAIGGGLIGSIIGGLGGTILIEELW